MTHTPIGVTRAAEPLITHTNPKVLSVVSAVLPEPSNNPPKSRFSAQWGDRVTDLFKQVRDPQVVAEQLGVPERSVRRFLAEAGLSYLALPAGKDAFEVRRWPPERILAAIRSAADAVGEPLSLARFHEWAKGSDENGPSERTVVVHFGSWRDACEAAGVRSWEPSRHYEPGVTEQDCWAALTLYVQECIAAGQKPTMTGYERLSGDRGWPCRNTVTLRLGPWRSAVASISVPAQV